jgi:endonuclease YncB( thermonuclease family)
MGKDRYGRTVADVFLPDNRLLNHELLKAGFAWWFRRYPLENVILEQLERGCAESQARPVGGYRAGAAVAVAASWIASYFAAACAMTR